MSKGSEEVEKNYTSAKNEAEFIATEERVSIDERLRYLEKLGYQILELSQALKKQQLLQKLEGDLHHASA